MEVVINVFRILMLCMLVTVHGQNPGLSIADSEVNKVLSNPNFVKQQINCVLAKAKCDHTGNQLKIALPEILARNCRSCSKQQMINARKIINFVKQNYPSEFVQIQARYGGHRG